MERNDELKEIDIKNCTCYYFEDIIRVGDFELINVLKDIKSRKNSFENILIYEISCKTISF